MNPEVIALSFALAADAFSVGASVGLSHRTSRQLFRLSFHFGLFQSLLAAIGATAGTLIEYYMSTIDHWISFVLLAGIGINMIVQTFRSKEEEVTQVDRTKGMTLIGLSIAVSIDAFAAGIGLPAFASSLPAAIFIIGIVSFLATMIAMKLASTVARFTGAWIEALAGGVLILLGVRIVLDHLAII